MFGLVSTGAGGMLSISLDCAFLGKEEVSGFEAAMAPDFTSSATVSLNAAGSIAVWGSSGWLDRC